MIPISFSISTKTTANETELRAMLIKTLFERILSNSSDLEQSTHETSGAVLMTDISHSLPSTDSSNDLSTVVRSESFLVANQSDRRTDRSTNGVRGCPKSRSAQDDAQGYQRQPTWYHLTRPCNSPLHLVSILIPTASLRNELLEPII